MLKIILKIYQQFNSTLKPNPIYKNNKRFSFYLYKHYIDSLSKILKDIGINVNSIPVLDVLRSNSSKIIGDRTFSEDKHIVRELGIKTVKYLQKNKISSIIKHIPGHGATKTDSHKRMPVVSLSTKKFIIPTCALMLIVINKVNNNNIFFKHKSSPHVSQTWQESQRTHLFRLRFRCTHARNCFFGFLSRQASQ